MNEKLFFLAKGMEKKLQLNHHINAGKTCFSIPTKRQQAKEVVRGET